LFSLKPPNNWTVTLGTQNLEPGTFLLFRLLLLLQLLFFGLNCSGYRRAGFESFIARFIGDFPRFR
jgi:hypothetical protein